MGMASKVNYFRRMQIAKDSLYMMMSGVFKCGVDLGFKGDQLGFG